MAKFRLISKTNRVIGYYENAGEIDLKDRRADMSTGLRDSSRNRSEIFVNDYIGKDGVVGIVKQDRPELMVGVGFYVEVNGEKRDEYELIVDEGWVKLGDIYSGY